MNRNQLTVIFFLIISSLILTIGSVLSAPAGTDYFLYLPIIQDPSPWQEVGLGSASGGGISNTGDVFYPSLAIAPDGTPYVAWEDDSSGNSEIYIRAWNGSSWVEVGAGSATDGGISNSIAGSFGASLAIAPDGMPYVAWSDDSSGNGEIYLRRWNGSSWEEVGAGSASGGGISNNAGHSSPPSLAIAPDGIPYVTWHDFSNVETEIYIRAWNGSSWAEVGAGSASGGGISNNDGNSWDPSLAIAPDGTPYVGWYDFSNEDDEIYVRAWNGSSWQEVGTDSASDGGITNSIFASRHPSFAIAPNGTPIIAWQVGNWNGLWTITYIYIMSCLECD